LHDPESAKAFRKYLERLRAEQLELDLEGTEEGG
jgi:hypothetical protein